MSLVGNLTGPYAWILTTFLEYAAKPFINWAIRKKYLVIDLEKGELISKRVADARENGTQAEYDDAVDSTFE